MDSQKITLHYATEQDIDTLLEMRVRFLNEYMPPDDKEAETELRKNLREYMKKVATGEYIGILAFADGKLAAAGGMVVWEAPSSYRMMRGRKGYILSIYTIPEFRRRGICGSIIDEFIEYARGHEIDTLHLHAGPMGDKIYRRAGFGEPHEPELVIYDASKKELA